MGFLQPPVEEFGHYYILQKTDAYKKGFDMIILSFQEILYANHQKYFE